MDEERWLCRPPCDARLLRFRPPSPLLRAYRLPLDAVGDDHGERAAVGDQRHDLRDDRFVGRAAIAGRFRPCAEGRVADGAALAGRGIGGNPAGSFATAACCLTDTSYSCAIVAGQSGVGQNTACGFIDAPSRQRRCSCMRLSLSPSAMTPLPIHLPIRASCYSSHHSRVLSLCPRCLCGFPSFIGGWDACD